MVVNVTTVVFVGSVPVGVSPQALGLLITEALKSHIVDMLVFNFFDLFVFMGFVFCPNLFSHKTGVNFLTLRAFCPMQKVH